MRTLKSSPYENGTPVKTPNLVASGTGAVVQTGPDVTGIDVLAACARALALIAPPDRILPALTEPLLVPAVTREVARTLAEHPPQLPYRDH